MNKMQTSTLTIFAVITAFFLVFTNTTISLQAQDFQPGERLFHDSRVPDSRTEKRNKLYVLPDTLRKNQPQQEQPAMPEDASVPEEDMNGNEDTDLEPNIPDQAEEGGDNADGSEFASEEEVGAGVMNSACDQICGVLNDPECARTCRTRGMCALPYIDCGNNQMELVEENLPETPAAETDEISRNAQP